MFDIGGLAVVGFFHGSVSVGCNGRGHPYLGRSGEGGVRVTDVDTHIWDDSGDGDQSVPVCLNLCNGCNAM